MALIEHGHGTLLFFQLRTSILTRLMRPGFDRRTARESWGQLNVKSPPPKRGLERRSRMPLRSCSSWPHGGAAETLPRTVL